MCEYALHSDFAARVALIVEVQIVMRTSRHWNEQGLSLYSAHHHFVVAVTLCGEHVGEGCIDHQVMSQRSSSLLLLLPSFLRTLLYGVEATHLACAPLH